MRASWQPYQFRSKTKISVVSQAATISLGYPLLFHWIAIALTSGLLLLSAVLHIVPLLAVTVFLLVLAAMSWLWSQYSLRHLYCRLVLSQDRVFPGEKIDLAFEVTNSKRLFLPWMKVEAELPYRLTTGKLKSQSCYTRERPCWVGSIAGNQRLSWKYNLECKVRGDYWLGPLRVRSGDIFGLFPRELILPSFEPLLVYPNIVSVDAVDLPLRDLAGEVVISRSIYEDASRTMGARDYQHGDAFKRIHWKASAHRAQLQARQYESTTGLNLLLVFDVYSFSQQQEENGERFELAVTIVASLAYKAYRENTPVGLIANAVPEVYVPVGSSRSSFMFLLEALARMQASAKVPLHRQFDGYQGALPMGTTLVIVTNDLSLQLISLVRKLQRAGYSLLVVSVGKKMPEGHRDFIRIVSVHSTHELSRVNWKAGP